MMKSAADRRQLARIQAAIDAHEAGLTPEQRAREKARLVYFAKPEAAALETCSDAWASSQAWMIMVSFGFDCGRRRVTRAFRKKSSGA